ncbi:MAG TPA: tetratricopeptide repeat protein [Allosphingosinicella sp.]
MTPFLIALGLVQAAASVPPAAPTPANPAGNDDTARLASCVELTRVAPERAVETANAWVANGGRLDARQCLGLAYVELGRWRAAATAYEQAAREADTAQSPRRTTFWVQAGNAWLAADDAARAIAAFDSALAVPTLAAELRGEVHLDRARAQVALQNSAGARTDLDRALELVPADPMAWYLSAALYARQDNLTLAARDIARARELARDNPDILLLAGTIAGLQGNGAEAERLYRQVAAAAPQTDAGRSAAAALASERDVGAAPAAAPVPSAPGRSAPVRPAPAPRPPQGR